MRLRFLWQVQMKKTIKMMVALCLLIWAWPTFAAILTQDGVSSTSNQPAQPPQPMTPPPTAPAPAPGQPQPAIQANQPINMQDLSNLTPEQSRDLLRQFKDLNPDQLEAIARSFQQQSNQQPEGNTATTAVTVTQTTTTTQQPAQPGQGAVMQTATTQAALGQPTEDGAPPERQKSLAEMQRDEAFNALINEQLPLSPDQITRLHKYYDLTLQAKATLPAPPPTPHFSSTTVNLEPGGSPPVIRLSAGFVTSLVFVDFNGDPWPLTAYSIGDPQNFNVQWDQKGHTIFVQSLKKYGHGNLAVRLWGLDTPVMITLVSGQKNVDFRVDLRVPGRGPDSKPPIVEILPSAKVSPLLINILDGIPPRGSVRLSVSGGHGEAWLSDSRVYFRTKLTVLSPAWTATVASPDGTHVYELMPTPYILATQNGKTVDIRLSGL